MTNLSFKNACPLVNAATDLAIAFERFTWTTEAGAVESDCGGRMLVQGLVEAYTHLHKSLIGPPWYRDEAEPQLTDIEPVAFKQFGMMR